MNSRPENKAPDYQGSPHFQPFPVPSPAGEQPAASAAGRTVATHAPTGRVKSRRPRSSQPTVMERSPALHPVDVIAQSERGRRAKAINDALTTLCKAIDGEKSSFNWCHVARYLPKSLEDELSDFLYVAGTQPPKEILKYLTEKLHQHLPPDIELEPNQWLLSILVGHADEPSVAEDKHCQNSRIIRDARQQFDARSGVNELITPVTASKVGIAKLCDYCLPLVEYIKREEIADQPLKNDFYGVDDLLEALYIKLQSEGYLDPKLKYKSLTEGGQIENPNLHPSFSSLLRELQLRQHSMAGKELVYMLMNIESLRKEVTIEQFPGESAAMVERNKERQMPAEAAFMAEAERLLLQMVLDTTRDSEDKHVQTAVAILPVYMLNKNILQSSTGDSPAAAPEAAMDTPPPVAAAQPKASDTKNSVLDIPLGIGDLLAITNHLYPIVEHSDITTLGLQMGLDPIRLKHIEQNTHDFLDDMITAWLRREGNVDKKGGANLRSLIRALEHPRVNQQGIARDIARDPSI